MPSQNISDTRSTKLSSILNVMLDVATALGTVREHQRLHEGRLANAEANITSLQQTMMTWRHSSPSQPVSPPTPPIPTTPISTATAPLDTTQAAKDILKRAAPKVLHYGLRELAPWILGRIVTWILPYFIPIASGLLLYGQSIWKWVGMTWRLVF